MRNASLGVEVIHLGPTAATSKRVYARDAETPRIPASNLKVITTSAALDRLGAGFKFRTVLLRHKDDLVLIGDGDPAFGDGEYLQKVGWRVTTVYEGWAAQLKKLGAGSIHDVIVDDSVFDDVFYHPHWPVDQLDLRYMAQVGGLNLNTNVVEYLVQPTTPGGRVSFTTDPATEYLSIQNRCVTGASNGIGVVRQPGTNTVTLRGQTPSRGVARVAGTVHDPSLFAGTVLSETMTAAGIPVTGAVRRDRTARQERLRLGTAAADWSVVGVHETPIEAIIGRANKDSVNLYAECLCKRLGCETTRTSGTWESGTAAVGGFLTTTVAVPAGEFRLDDGSGLSKENAISPHAIASVLAYDFYAKNRDIFFPSLSVAGVDGTLKDRFRAAPVRDLRERVFGKSGFVEGVSTLCGYLHARDGQWYAFSIMLNGIPRGSNGEIKPLQEKIVKAIED